MMRLEDAMNALVDAKTVLIVDTYGKELYNSISPDNKFPEYFPDLEVLNMVYRNGTCKITIPPIECDLVRFGSIYKLFNCRILVLNRYGDEIGNVNFSKVITRYDGKDEALEKEPIYSIDKTDDYIVVTVRG